MGGAAKTHIGNDLETNQLGDTQAVARRDTEHEGERPEDVREDCE